MLQLQDITFSYGDTPLLKHINLAFEKGTITGIMGESGSGKSTLLQIIAGRLQWQDGNVLLNQVNLPGPNDQLLPEHDEIRLVAQDFELNLYYSVQENIRNVILHWEEEEIQEAVTYWLDKFGLTEFKDQKTNTLSGGQKQRLAWIRSLVDLPDVILLDEPTNQIDENFAFQFLSAIHDQVKSEHKIAILVTHQSKEILQWADRVLLMQNGQVVRDDLPEEVYTSPKNAYEAKLFGPVNKIDEQWVRPHEVLLVKNPQGKLKVLKNAFLGAYYEVILETHHGQQIIAHTGKHCQIGEKLDFHTRCKND